jgi:hypothetical protein
LGGGELESEISKIPPNGERGTNSGRNLQSAIGWCRWRWRNHLSLLEGDLIEFETAVWSVPNATRLRDNLLAVADALSLADREARDLFQFDVGPPEAFQGESAQLLANPDQMPILIAFQTVGLMLRTANKGARIEVGKRLASIMRPLRKKDWNDKKAISSILSAAFEAYTFLLVANTGYEGKFLYGAGSPDLLFRKQKLLIECKDCQVDWASSADYARAEAKIRDKIAEAESQLQSFEPGNDLTRLAVIDLPDQAKERIEEMTEGELIDFQRNVAFGITDPARIWFTHFPVHQHLDFAVERSVRLEPATFMNAAYFEGINIRIADLYNRVRYFIRGHSFPVPPPIYED